MSVGGDFSVMNESPAYTWDSKVVQETGHPLLSIPRLPIPS